MLTKSNAPAAQSQYSSVLRAVGRSAPPRQSGEVEAAADDTTLPATDGEIAPMMDVALHDVVDPVPPAMQPAVQLPESAEAALAAATALMDGGDLAGAEQLLVAARSAYPDRDFDFLIVLARIARSRGDLNQAAIYWRAFREAFPNHGAGYVGEIESLRDDGKIDEAEQLFAIFKERFASEPVVPLLEVAFASRRGDLALVAACWTRARQANPASSFTWSNEASALRAAGRGAEADDVLTEAAKRFPDELQLSVQWAESAMLDRNWSAALPRWTMTASRFPGAAEPAFGLARLARASEGAAGDPGQLQQICERFPNEAEMYTGLAAAQAAHGQVEQAEETLRAAVQRFPNNGMAAYDFAAIAERIGDWPTAADRWREALVRFPSDDLRTRLHVAEIRLLERGIAPVEQTRAATPMVEFDAVNSVPSPRELALHFESLGGHSMGCEFGMFQRSCGAEPLGLLRWAEMTPRDLIAVLNSGFVGVGLPENTELATTPTPNGLAYVTRDRRFLMSMHTFVKVQDTDEQKFFEECCRRIQYLRDKLIADLRSGEKIFVYRMTPRDVTDEEVTAIGAALRLYGDNMFLVLRYADERNPSGSVRFQSAGIMVGYMDRFQIARSGDLLSLPAESWLATCRSAYALWRSAARTAPVAGPAIAPVAAGAEIPGPAGVQWVEPD